MTQEKELYMVMGGTSFVGVFSAYSKKPDRLLYRAFLNMCLSVTNSRMAPG